jgi:hypothetical protein
MNNDTLNASEYGNGKLPQGLNVLTILTLIWGGISVLSTLWGFMNAKTSLENKDKMMAQMNDPKMPSFVKSMMPDLTHFEEMVTKSFENRIPILLLGVVATVLCIVGALQMRKRKKQGFLFYIIGSFLPFLTSILFIGWFTLSGFVFYLMLFVSLLFGFLYFRQQKYMVS